MNYQPTYLGELDLSDDTLTHFGIKGMKWGRRKKKDKKTKNAMKGDPRYKRSKYKVKPGEERKRLDRLNPAGRKLSKPKTAPQSVREKYVASKIARDFDDGRANTENSYYQKLQGLHDQYAQDFDWDKFQSQKNKLGDTKYIYEDQGYASIDGRWTPIQEVNNYLDSLQRRKASKKK